MPQYKVIKIKINKLKELFSLVKNYNKNHYFVKNISFFKWQYFYKKNINGFFLSFKNKFYAFQLYIPLSQYDKNLSNKEIFLTNFYSTGKLLGAGFLVFQKIIDTLKPNFIGSSGIWSNQLLHYHKRLNFKVGILDHYVYLSPYLKNFKIYSSKQKKNKSIYINKILNKKSNYFLMGEKKIKQFNNLKFKQYYPTKSSKYILNRYYNHPKYDYLIYGINEKMNNSLIVFRIQNYNSSNIIKIIEYFGSNQDFIKYKDLFKILLLEKKSEYLSFYSHGMNKQIILKSGFVLKREKSEIYPELFRPLTKKNIKLSFAYKTRIKKKIRFFLGDGDRDRPN